MVSTRERHQLPSWNGWISRNTTTHGGNKGNALPYFKGYFINVAQLQPDLMNQLFALSYSAGEGTKK